MKHVSVRMKKLMILLHNDMLFIIGENNNSTSTGVILCKILK